ncbi:MAG TPA: HAMP domain-containing sensor histidine kinase [Herpetosiphonaceae bacterium]
MRYQLALVVGALLSGLLVTFSIVLYLSVQQFLFWQTANQLTTSATTAVSEILPKIQVEPATIASSEVISATTPITDLQALAGTLADSRTSVIVRAPDGTALVQELPSGTTIVTSESGLAPAASELTRAPGTGAGATAPSVVVGGEPRQVSVFVPLFDRQGTWIGTLQVATPAEPLDAVLARLFQYLVLGTFVTVLGGMALSVFASARMLRPLNKLVAASAAVADGDLTTRVHLPHANEIGKLGNAFDEMIARMAESWERQQRFVADAAHELRTPLTAISGSIEMLQIGAVDHQPERRQRLLDSVSQELDRMGRLVHDLLLLSQLDSHSPPVHEPFDLRPLLVNVVEQCRIVAPNHQFVLDLPDALPVLGNADQLRQVFLNLLTNAHTYTPLNGTITVVGRADRAVTVKVADTGIGIPGEDLPHVWERLYRVDRSRVRRTGGSGLGLSIVQTLVAAHNGSVDITSEVGKGTTVVVTLPRNRAFVQEAANPSGNL